MRAWAFLLAVTAYASEVKVLTKDNFDEVIKGNKHVLVEFYAPWCGHCKALEPEFDKAATELGDKVVLGKVDATIESDLGRQYSVQGYPTLKWFTDGSESEYDGGRTADTIVDWIKTMTGPVVSTEAPPETATKPIVVLHAPELDSGFEKTAERYRREAAWHHVTSDEKKVTIKHPKEPELSTDDFSNITKFFEDNKFPLFGILDGDSFSKYTSRGAGLVWVLLPMAKGEIETAVTEHRDEMMKVASAFKGEYSVTYTDTDAFKDAVSSMLGVTEFPKIAVQKKAGDKKKYIYEGAFESGPVIEFIKDVAAGKIAPKLRSEEPPAKNDAPVKVIVGSELEQHVFSATKDVLFEVYAPWCGHCKKIEPEYEKLAKKVRKEGLEDMLTIAKMDGTANDSPVDTIEYSGFPSIFYIKAGSDKPQKYEGERTAKAMWKWIKKEHSKSSELKEKISSNKDKAKEEL